MLLKDLTNRQIDHVRAKHCATRTFCTNCPMRIHNVLTNDKRCILNARVCDLVCLKQQNTITIDDKLLE